MKRFQGLLLATLLAGLWSTGAAASADVDQLMGKYHDGSLTSAEKETLSSLLQPDNGSAVDQPVRDQRLTQFYIYDFEDIGAGATGYGSNTSIWPSTAGWDDTDAGEAAGDSWDAFDDSGNGNSIYVMADSDEYGGGGVRLTETLTSPAIDCSGWINVELGMLERYDPLGAQTGTIEISNDGGVTWSQVHQHTNQEVGTVGQTGYPDAVTAYDVSTWADNQADVRLRFIFDDGDGWNWFWKIDDVSLSGDMPAAEDVGLSFTSTPSVFPGESGLFEVTVSNVGTDMLDASGTVDLDVDGDLVADATGAFGPIAGGGSELVQIIVTVPALEGDYTATATAVFAADGFLGNNVDSALYTVLTPPISTFPYAQDFDLFPSGTFPDTEDWVNGNGSDYGWQTDYNGTTSGSTGAAADHTSGTGNYVFTETSSGIEGSTFFLDSPLFNVASLSAPQVSFWYHMYGATIGTLALDVYDHALDTWTTDVWSLSGQQHASDVAPWLQATASLAGFGDVVQLRFRGVRGTSYTGDICLDDVLVGEAPDIDIAVVIDSIGDPVALGGDLVVDVTVSNNGGTRADAVIDLDWDGVAGAEATTTLTNIQAGSPQTYQFVTPAPGVTGPYTATISTTVQGGVDGNPLNDTATAGFDVVDPTLPPSNLVASDTQYDQITVTWDAPDWFGVPALAPMTPADLPFELPAGITHDKAEAILADFLSANPGWWEAQNTNSRAFIEYVVYRDLVEAGRTVATSFVDDIANGMVPETTYSYTVTADWDEGETLASNADDGFAFMRPTSGGPDAGGYTWINSNDVAGPAFGWVEINVVGTDLGISGDDTGEGVALPFNFPFYGVDKTYARASSNGYLTFGTDSTDYSNDPVPNATDPNDSIFPFWDDLTTSSLGAVYFYDDAANNRAIFQWDGVPKLGSSDLNTFQILLYDNGDIVVQYLDMPGLVNSATVGIENSDGSIGLQVNYNDVGGSISNNLAVLMQAGEGEFIPPVIVHTPLVDTLQDTGVYPVSADITDDSGIASASVFYQVDGGGFLELPMSSVMLEAWSVDMPAQALGSAVDYYITATDASTNSNTATSVTWSFYVGDQTAPVITHTPLTNTEDTVNPYVVTADVTDDSPLASVTLYYQVDGGGYIAVPMMVPSLELYAGDIPAQTGGSVIDYYIEAIDSAVMANTTTTATYSFEVVDYTWPPINLTASDGSYGGVTVTWGTPVAPPDPNFESFEFGIPSAWTIYDENADLDQWVAYTSSFYAYDGDVSARVYTDFQTTDDWLVTDARTGTATSSITYQLRNYSASEVDEYEVYAIGSATLPTAADFLATGTQLAAGTLPADTDWHEFTHDLSAFDGQNVYVAWRCVSDDGWYLMLDAVQFTDLEQVVLMAGGNGEFETGPSVEELMAKLNISKVEAMAMVDPVVESSSRDFLNYNVYRDGGLVGTTPDLTYFDVPPVAGQDYTYHVTALFDAGESDPSNTDLGNYLARPTSGGPDLFGYTWINSDDVAGPAFSWNDISVDPGAIAVPLGDDAFAGPFALGIDFPFYGVDQTECNITSNGFINFGTGSSSLSNQNFPSTSTPNNVIAPFWDDLDPGGAFGSIHYLVDTAHSRFIVQFTDVPDYPDATGGQNTFQAVLNADGSIEIFLSTILGERNSATIGIENADGTDGLAANYNDVGGRIGDSMAYLFTPPAACDPVSNLAVNIIGGNALISWDAMPSATDYMVYGAADGYGPFTLLGSTSGSTSYLDSGAQLDGRVFYYVVSVCD